MCDLKFFNVPESMKQSAVCCICGKGECDILVQENVPGGAGGAFHETCLDTFFNEEKEQDE